MHSTLAPSGDASTGEKALRIDLAAAFRLAAQFDWHESVGNHFSAAIDAKGKRFLLNPKWKHFSTIRASDLLCLNAEDADAMQQPDAPDATAWCIHGAMHGALPSARVLLHCHPTYSTALCSLIDPTLLPIDQNTARFYQRIAYDLDFDGVADNAEEGLRLVRALGESSVLMMGSHGVTVAAQTVAHAFDSLYYLERAARTLVLAYSTGQPLKIMSHELAEKTAQGWERYQDFGVAHFEELKRILDAADPSYRD